VIFQGQNLLEMEPEERAKAVFLAFQYPLEIPGSMTLCGIQFRRKQHGLEELDSFDFDEVVQSKLKW